MMMPPRFRRAQLAGDGDGGLEVGLEDGVVEIAHTDEAAGVHIDSRHRLGLVDDQVAAGLEIDTARQGLLDLFLDAVQVEQRALAGVVIEQRQHGGREFLGKTGQALKVFAGVDGDAGDFRIHEIAQHALAERKLLIENGRRRADARLVADVGANLAQVGDVGGEFLVAGILGHGADDEAAGFVGRHQAGDLFAQRLALGLGLDALRDADMFFLRQVDQHAAGNGNLRRQPGALGADRVLDDLDDDALAFRKNAFDRPFGRRFARLPDIGHVQEGGALEPDIDEGRLHAGEDAADTPEIDVADQAAAGRALDVQFLDDALLHDGNAGFLRGEIDQYFFRHGHYNSRFFVRFYYAQGA